MKPDLHRLGILFAAALAFGPLTAGASDGGPSSGSASGAEEHGAYRTVEVVQGGRVTGRVSLQGTPPAPKPLPEKRPGLCTAPPVNPYVVDKDGSLANAIVYLKDIDAGKKMVPGKATLEQHECSYVPHLQAVPLGTTLTITNRDPVMHCAHAFIEDTMAFNYARPVKDQPMEKVLDKPGFTRIRCEIHKWMTSVVAVMPSPYFAVTGPDGKFVITDIPPGSYTLAVWHEALGEQTAPVVVAPDGEGVVNFVFKTRSAGAAIPR